MSQPVYLLVSICFAFVLSIAPSADASRFRFKLFGKSNTQESTHIIRNSKHRFILRLKDSTKNRNVIEHPNKNIVSLLINRKTLAHNELKYLARLSPLERVLLWRDSLSTPQQKREFGLNTDFGTLHPKTKELGLVLNLDVFISEAMLTQHMKPAEFNLLGQLMADNVMSYQYHTNSEPIEWIKKIEQDGVADPEISNDGSVYFNLYENN